MPRTFSLAAVLALRQQKEEAEERALTAVTLQMGQVQATLRRLQQEIDQINEARAREVNSVDSGAQTRANYAKCQVLREAEQELREQLKALESDRQEQQARYLRARCDREALVELRDQREEAWQAEVRTREQKILDDLFNAHRTRS